MIRSGSPLLATTFEYVPALGIGPVELGFGVRVLEHVVVRFQRVLAEQPAGAGEGRAARGRHRPPCGAVFSSRSRVAGSSLYPSCSAAVVLICRASSRSRGPSASSGRCPSRSGCRTTAARRGALGDARLALRAAVRGLEHLVRLRRPLQVADGLGRGFLERVAVLAGQLAAAYRPSPRVAQFAQRQHGPLAVLQVARRNRCSPAARSSPRAARRGQPLGGEELRHRVLCCKRLAASGSDRPAALAEPPARAASTAASRSASFGAGSERAEDRLDLLAARPALLGISSPESVVVAAGGEGRSIEPGQHRVVPRVLVLLHAPVVGLLVLGVVDALVVAADRRAPRRSDVVLAAPSPSSQQRAAGRRSRARGSRRRPGSARRPGRCRPGRSRGGRGRRRRPAGRPASTSAWTTALLPARRRGLGAGARPARRRRPRPSWWPARTRPPRGPRR